MKICFIASADSIHSYRWIRFFARRGHQVDWLSRFPPAHGYIDDVNFYHIGQNARGVLHTLKSILEARSLLRTIQPDVLHVHFAVTNGLVGRLSGFRPVALTAWGSDVLVVGRQRIYKPMVRGTLRHADVITCDANHMRRAIIEYGVDPEKVRLVYFGTDTQKFQPREKDRALRQQLGVGDAPMVISLRSFTPIYDVQTLIKAAPLVLEKYPQTQFVLAGGGPQEQMLKDLADSLQVEEHVKFVGLIPQAELPRYLSSSDVYVSTSLSDAGLAASTAEAMACGVPAVVTDFGENGMWVQDGESGLLFPMGDVEALADRIVRILENDRIRDDFGRAGRQVIEEKNNYYREMEKMEDIYLELVRAYQPHAG